MSDFGVVLCILGFVAVLVLLVLHSENKAARTWHTVATGIFSRAEYGEHSYKKRSGSMTHTSRTAYMDTTVVFFSDGRSFPCRGRLDMPYPAGTPIEIRQNEMGWRDVNPLNTSGVEQTGE